MLGYARTVSLFKLSPSNRMVWNKESYIFFSKWLFPPQIPLKESYNYSFKTTSRKRRAYVMT